MEVCCSWETMLEFYGKDDLRVEMTYSIEVVNKLCCLNQHFFSYSPIWMVESSVDRHSSCCVPDEWS